MPVYKYRCQNPECDYKVEILVLIAKRNDEFGCDYCMNGKMKRILESPHIKEGGQGTDPDTWSDKFWDGAENERLAEQKKKQTQKQERVFYDDKATAQKIENKKTNLERQGAENELAGFEKAVKKVKGK